MADQFFGEIRITAFNFPPKGWALCNGQLLPINQNQALFSLLGTTYGGDGRTTFALPDLQGRAPVHAIGGTVQLGEKSGSENVTLIASQVPGHSHSILGSGNQASSINPNGMVLAQKPRGGANVYGGPPNTALAVESLTPTSGGGQPHSNMQPYTALSFIIALQGIYPARD
jgi:microcystin-dependent protein